ncbi:MAG: UDP-3-O-(3-hydroxymyristoyl)glucosamine N-acyltransferase [Puniceicoccales bacterium]|jgi:UDP-3-O-[3-hydroxymyristoyl] glucosamine N-acyltransferase|nr:UDP-3-O-(3-hydroxymyristoyl)glucosamine N-acyltransferase [Puniceicoccales bacterium]
MQFQFSVEELQGIVQPSHINGVFQGKITQISNLREAKSGSLSFLSNPKYSRDVAHCEASVLLLPENFDHTPKENQVIFFCKNPSIALAKICQYIEKLNADPIRSEIHPTAMIHPTATLGKDVSIGAYVVVEEGVRIGEKTVIDSGTFIGKYSSIGQHCKIWPNVSLMSFSQIGNRVTLHSGVVIGSDGFGFVAVDEFHQKIPQVGNVVLEDFVEIGANTTIDRARFASTIIGQGTKIDNLVQIGHNVKIGKNCIIVAQVGIAGSTIIGDRVTIGGQVGIAGHLHIADGTQICAQSGVTKNTEPNVTLLGSPATPYRDAVRQFAALTELPKILKKFTKFIKNRPADFREKP